MKAPILAQATPLTFSMQKNASTAEINTPPVRTYESDMAITLKETVWIIKQAIGMLNVIAINLTKRRRMFSTLPDYIIENIHKILSCL